MANLNAQITHELYLDENLVGKYNGYNLYRKIFVSPSATLQKDADTKLMEGLPLSNKIISMSVSYIVNNDLYDVTSMYYRAYVNSNGHLYVKQTVGSAVTLVARADVYYVK